MWWNNYIGIPFQSKGRSRRGCDCWGLLRLVYAEKYGVDLPSHLDDYSNAKERVEIGNALTQHKVTWDVVREPNAKEGDVILFTLSGIPFHCGLIIQRGLMLHIISGVDSCIEPYLSAQWIKRIEGVYRYAR